MVHVYATRRGYYYKTYKNGSKKRISEKEYLKKRNKKIYGGGGINKNNFSNVSLITDNSTEGLIWKVTYKNKDYVFKEFLKKSSCKLTQIHNKISKQIIFLRIHYFWNHYVIFECFN